MEEKRINQHLKIVIKYAVGVIKSGGEQISIL